MADLIIAVAAHPWAAAAVSCYGIVITATIGETIKGVVLTYAGATAARSKVLAESAGAAARGFRE